MAEFRKKIRNRIGPFRFYHCGEYGEATKKNNYIARPHYHACIFGLDFSDDRTYWRESIPEWGTTSHQMYRSKALERCWGKGYAEIGTLTQESAGYTARYIMKKINGKKQDAAYLHKKTGVIKIAPYTTMSTRPGIGKSWFDKYHKEVFPLDHVIVKGRPSRPPKYYDDQLKILDATMYEDLKITRKLNQEKNKEDHTPQRLKDREEVLKAKTRTLKRSL